ncbi:MAG: SpoIIE family protein phosphatase [Desulfobacterales bacterium]|nr:SpoIIE family protein phosphatase [Desulfobacterales bacterium]
MQYNEKRQLKLLVVDDEPSITRLVAESLRTMPLEIRTANSGEEALVMIRETPADILITDIYMPDVTGLELLEKVLQIHPETLGIAITGNRDIDIAVKFMKKGGVDFLEKPFSRQIIRLSVESAAEKFWLKKELKLAGEELIQKNKELQQEIAERKRSEQALQESEKRFRGIFENAPVGIFQTTLDGKFIKANPAIAHILGYASSDEMTSVVTNIGEQLYVRPEQRKEIAENVLSHNGWTTAEADNYRKDKKPIVIKIMMRALRDSNSVPLCFEGFIEDITEKKQQAEAFNLEMSRAKELYDLVLRPRMPLTDGVGINMKCIPAENVGGDVLEILKVDEKKFLLFLADVTGHGIPAAMTASTLKILVKEIAESDTDPGRICRHLNNTIHQIILPDDAIAVFCGLADTESMTLDYYLSGLPFPFIVRNNEQIYLKPTGLPLGVFDDMVADCSNFRLEKGDLFLALTDGITEAKSGRGELFGKQGVTGCVERIKHDMHTIVDCIVNKTCMFQETDIFHDDVIILAVHFFAENEISSVIPCNRFFTPGKYIIKMKTKHISVDHLMNLVMECVTENSEIPSGKLKKFRLAFFELLVNAVEHGSLEMTGFKRDYDCFDSEKYQEIYKQRMYSKKYGDRLIRIEYLYNSDQLEITVEDDGDGFDIDDVPDPFHKDHIRDTSGRGIAIARMNAGQIIYNAKGNKVTLTMY